MQKRKGRSVSCSQEEILLKFILGIDQGGTKTAAALMGMDGRIYGTGYEKGSYFPVHGMENAVLLMEKTVEKAMAQSGGSVGDIETVVAGITGVDWPGDDGMIAAALEKNLPEKEIKVYNDAVIALYGGTFDGSGAVICAGTGLNAAICKNDGECFVFGDYLGENLQGATALAQRGARAVFDAQLGIGKAEQLTELYLRFAGAKDSDDLLHKYMTDKEFQDRLRFIVPDLVALAEKGDETTRKLLEQFAEELNTYITAGLKKMDMADRALDIVLAGSVFKGKGNLLTNHLMRKIGEDIPNANVLPAKYEPVVGACVMGMLQKQEFTEEMKRNLSDSAECLSLLR